MLMVMIGVLIALFVDEWRENRQLKQTVAVTEERIIAEAHGNYEIIVGHGEDLDDRLSQLISWGSQLDESLSVREQLTDFPGFPQITLNNASWQRANSSQITNYIDIDLAERIYPLYEWNQRVESSISPMLDIFYNKDAWDRELNSITYDIIESIFRESISQTNQAERAYTSFVESFPIGASD